MPGFNDILDTRATTVNVFDVLGKVYGARGIPFPGKPKEGDNNMIATGFENFAIPPDRTIGKSGVIKQYTDSVLGRYEFLPATINNVLIPNAVVLITGEKEIIETTVIDNGTVFEKVFERPFDITIIATLISDDGNWPENDFIKMAKLFRDNDLVTLKCASTNNFLQPENNFLIKKIDLLDSAGSENVEVIQFSGRSNVDFLLEIV
ncbi:DUF6046 domain-containing protein [Pinibacter soli]|uniref:DUF6046 domain-containing protein n=1 Tax=Pinibacter soli TaxID=3044211 RepID=A0ABT6R987_9BACT|nr:DUF6046 domain-containing protein [Pinibacter soli]MDI3319128.1 DUF6046 domain-containing protein [Pinibacter soli]